MYIHRVSQYIFPENIDVIFDFMYEAKNLSQELIIQEVNPKIGMGRIISKESFHSIMCMTRIENTFSDWMFNVSKIIDSPKEYKMTIDIGLKVKFKSNDYFIFLKLNTKLLEYFVEKYGFKKVNLNLLK